MKFLKKINFDSKAIIQDLRDLNDSLINAVSEYQQVIFELKEDIEMQREEIERLKIRNDELNALNKTVKSEAIREFAERVKKEALIESGFEVLQSGAIDNLVKEMVGDE